MIVPLRQSFNSHFEPARYQEMLEQIEQEYPGELDYRIAETPVFVDREFKNQLLETCSFIIDQILEPSFLERTEKAIPDSWRIPGREGKPDFLAFDFGVCTNESGQLFPQLIELQGFPSLFGYQSKLANWYSHVQSWENGLTPYLSGLNKETYTQLLREIIVGEHDPAEVILLEILPHQQKTRLDFSITHDMLGIPTVCITELMEQEGDLFYRRANKLYPIKRIYNRIIFDELQQQPAAIREKSELLFRCDRVEWCPHPNWFYRVSKYLLPYLKHPFVPLTYFLDQITQLPSDLSQYVLKPLFSFAGQGVIIDPTPEDLSRISDPSNWILQRKVTYAPVIPTPDDPAKVEIRLFYFWPSGAERPIPALTLARLSKGKMVGTRYNKDREWVGGSICLFES
ncbi:MAG: hypothetical protein ACKO6Q_01455 [Bacteroidota bacterium]